MAVYYSCYSHNNNNNNKNGTCTHFGIIWQFGFKNLWLSRASSMHNNNNINNNDNNNNINNNNKEPSEFQIIPSGSNWDTDR